MTPQRVVRILVVRWSAAAVVAVMLVGSGWWAGRVAFGPPADRPAELGAVTVTVTEASVGRSLSLNATMVQPFSPLGVNGLAGTVTAVAAGGAAVHIGETVYSVDTVPVRVVEGETPFWRDLSQGVDGNDVAQLQRALAVLGLYAGEADGRFRFATGQSVRAWQAELGVEANGVVRLGELVAVPQLPVPVGLADGIVPGARLAGGETAVLVATGEVEAWLVVASGQEALIPPDAQVVVAHDDARWTAVLGESGFDEAGHVRFALLAPQGGPICGDDCADLPAQERLSLRATVTVVPELTGPAVPVAAVRTDTTGQAWVRMADGARQDVSVLGSAGGVAVVDGLQVGERVRVFGAAGDPDPDDLGQPGEDGADAGS